ncbi:hypothetical protein PIROE2DRAFT_37364 [Piromyces sp. E2]|nr:hypothetical protein PIROE2DRAFT_37364 [Piromyces sp. E2]|eukprot:OUM70461.1 hypothetical protein PIROE2DRAFT_37364 [Piromyces sp. E2]
MDDNYPNIEYIFSTIIDNDESHIASIHMNQAINGVEIRNSAINVNVDRITGSIISTSVSIWDNLSTSSNATLSGTELNLSDAINILYTQLELGTTPLDLQSMEVEQAFDNHVRVLNIPFTYDHTLLARKVYIVLGEGNAELVWEFTMEMSKDFLVVCVSIDTKKVINLLDLSNHATYRVVPISSPNIGHYSRATYKDPFFKEYSPLGWHNNNSKKFSDTRGNNVIVYENSDGDDTIDNNKPINGGKQLKFEFIYNEDRKTLEENQSAAAANVFYVVNILHDIFFKLGFTEANGNFQTHNFSGNGKGGDAVEVRISDRIGENNARMDVGKDGVKAILRLFPFTLSNNKIERDPAFDNQILIHEYSHGVTLRMVGGPDKADCLRSTVEAVQLNEGYSDFFAETLQFREGINRNTPIRLFEYVIDGGARKYPLTSNTKYNNLKYSNLNSNIYYGALIWSTILHEVFWNIVDSFTNDPDYFLTDKKTSFSPSNYLAIRFVVDSFKELPCEPTFIDSRTAYLSAIEHSNLKESHKKKMKCLAWNGFAKRGLGVNAKGADKNGKYKNDFTMPSECHKYKDI